MRYINFKSRYLDNRNNESIIKESDLVHEQLAESIVFKIRNLLESHVGTKQYFYHVSDKEELVLENKGLWVASRKHNIYALNSLPKTIKSVWKLKPRKNLDIFNYFNESDHEKLIMTMYSMTEEEIERETKKLYEMNSGMMHKKLVSKRDLIFQVTKKIEAIQNNKDSAPRWFGDMEIISGILQKSGFDGWVEDGLVKDKITPSIDIIIRTALFVFDARKSLEIIEKLNIDTMDYDFRHKAIRSSERNFGVHDGNTNNSRM